MLLTLALLASAPAPVVDGDFADWPEDVHLRRVGEFVHVRLPATGTRSLTGGPENLALLLDLDGDPETGDDQTRVGGITGVDLRIDFNAVWPSPPPGERGRRGTMVRAYDEDGTMRPLHQWDVSLQSAPTHAADDFEVRLLPAGLPGLADGARGVYLIQDRGADLRTVARSPVLRAGPAVEYEVERVAVPAKAGDLRVMAWNVLYDGPAAAPGPFGRIIAAADPDVVLVQEWSRDPFTGKSVEAWFGEHVGGSWEVVTSDAQGVFVATRLEVLAAGPSFLEATPTNRDDPSARVASAVVSTPAGPVAVASVHLKCCGFYLSDEDKKRWAEARVAEAALRRLAEGGAPAVVGGDFNLVGSPGVLVMDVNGPLTAATPAVLGDPMLLATWRDEKQDFARSRLDYVLSTLTPAASFVIDSTLLDDDRIQPEDSLASDHLPIVVDYVFD